jgi:hypothetical protein
MKKNNVPKNATVDQKKYQDITNLFVMDIQIINANSRSVIMFPVKHPVEKTSAWDKTWRKTFRSGDCVVYAQCATNPGWSEDVYVGMLQAWRLGAWRKLDMRRSEDRR